MPLSASEIAVVAKLLDKRVAGALVQKVSQPRDDALLFTVFVGHSGKTRILVDLAHGNPSLHPTERKMPNPPEAPAFCRLLRKLVGNGRIREVFVHRGERIAFVDLDKMVDDKPLRRRLVVELLPHQPAVFVLDEKGVILAASTAIRNEHRDCARDEIYTPPPPPPSDREPSDPFARFEGWTEDDLFERLDALTPERLEAGIDRRALRKEIAKAVKRQFKRIGKIEADLRRAEGGEQQADEGELLKGALHEIERGMSEVRVRDWTREGEVWVTIGLDPKLSPRQNLEQIFKKAKKNLRGRELVVERLEEQRERLKKLQDLDARIDCGDSEELGDLAAVARSFGLEVQAVTDKPVKAKKGEIVGRRKPYKTYISADGIEIWVGRSSRDNDELTFKCSRGREWWLHAEDYAGSHVVVKTDGELPQETLLDAAHLAVAYSKANSGGKQAVSYTRRKNVTKFKGAPAGKVLLQSHRTIVVRFETDRLKRLETRPAN